MISAKEGYRQEIEISDNPMTNTSRDQEIDWLIGYSL